jgi:hypothetical protein
MVVQTSVASKTAGEEQKRLRWAIGSSTMRWMRTSLRLEAVDATLNIVLLPLHLCEIRAEMWRPTVHRTLHPCETWGVERHRTRALLPSWTGLVVKHNVPGRAPGANPKREQ